MATETDVTRLGDILALLKREGLKVSALVVGDIRVAFASEPTVDKPKGVIASQEQRELDALRERGRKLFGRVLPDDELKQMRGAL